MTWVIKNEDHYFITVLDSWSLAPITMIKIQNRSYQHATHDHDKLIALVTVTFDQKGTLSWFGITPLSWIIGINSTSTWGCWPCQKRWINQISFGNMDHTCILVSGFITFTCIPIPLILLHPAKSIAYGPFDSFHPWQDIKLSTFHLQYDVKLYHLVLLLMFFPTQ